MSFPKMTPSRCNLMMRANFRLSVRHQFSKTPFPKDHADSNQISEDASDQNVLLWLFSLSRSASSKVAEGRLFPNFVYKTVEYPNITNHDITNSTNIPVTNKFQYCDIKFQFLYAHIYLKTNTKKHRYDDYRNHSPAIRYVTVLL